MGRVVSGRTALFAGICGLTVQVAAGCGSANDPDDGTGGSGEASGGASGGASGSPGEGGSIAEAGSPDNGSGGSEAGRGGPGSGGRVTTTGGRAAGGFVSAGGAGGFVSSGGIDAGGSGTGGHSGGFVAGGFHTGGFAGSGGGSTCNEGAPCTCKALSGIIECDAGEPTCVCPPAAECAQPTDEPCFEPCGGEPFGAWVLEESCFAASITEEGAGCQRYVTGAPDVNDLRIRILDGGRLEVFGSESWSFHVQASLACFGYSSTLSCAFAFQPADTLLFSGTPSTSCTSNACGVCDCASEVWQQHSTLDGWSRDGNELMLGWHAVPYCAKGGELWIGGTDGDGSPKVSYKFKKQSCSGTPLPCASRTTEECELGGSCRTGACKATSTGNPVRCAVATSAVDCGVLQGCSWDAEGCAGSAAGACTFENCDLEPGCSFGPPQEKCVGEAELCEWRDVSQCAGLGCSVRSCTPIDTDSVPCQELTAVECVKAPGCMVALGATSACGGTTLCSQQSDAAVCSKLYCFDEQSCAGTSTACSALSLNDCPTVPGCSREW